MIQASRTLFMILLATWNGRFMGIGGGGFMGGSGSFALDADGQLSWQLIRDNGHLGIHEMTVTVKALDTLLAERRDRAGEVTQSRPLCRYPLVAKYKGTGSTDDAANFVCSEGF
jgi:hypothetical protein